MTSGGTRNDKEARQRNFDEILRSPFATLRASAYNDK